MSWQIEEVNYARTWNTHGGIVLATGIINFEGIGRKLILEGMAINEEEFLQVLKLVAAARDMLEALKLVRNNSDRGAFSRIVENKIDYAIAKAEGK